MAVGVELEFASVESYNQFVAVLIRTAKMVSSGLRKYRRRLVVEEAFGGRNEEVRCVESEAAFNSVCEILSSTLESIARKVRVFLRRLFSFSTSPTKMFVCFRPQAYERCLFASFFVHKPAEGCFF